MHIVNGRVTGDERGNIRCVANGGRSVVDYILVYTRFYNRVLHFEVCVRTESDHFPLLCKLGCAFQNNHVSSANESPKSKVLPSKLDRFRTSIEAIKVSKDFSGSRWALFGETISVNDLYYFVSVNELG